MLQNLDQALFNLIHNLAGKSRLLDLSAIFFAEYAGYFLIIAAVIILGLFLEDWKKRLHYFFWIVLALILSRGIFTELIRFFYYRPRPFVALNFTSLIDQADKGAFPSGHAAFYFALAGVVFLINKKAGQYLIAGAILIGFARVFAGVHWPLDIAGGALVAFLSVYIVRLLLDPYQLKTISEVKDGGKEGVLG